MISILWFIYSYLKKSYSLWFCGQYEFLCIFHPVNVKTIPSYWNVSLLFKESHLNLSRKHQKGKPLLKSGSMHFSVHYHILFQLVCYLVISPYFSCSVWREHSSVTTRFSSWMKQQHPLTWKQTISYRESSPPHLGTKLSSLLP